MRCPTTKWASCCDAKCAHCFEVEAFLTCMAAVEIPLARSADRFLGRLASATGARTVSHIDGMTLLGERAMLAGMAIPGQISAGGGCRLFNATDDAVALNLSRP